MIKQIPNRNDQTVGDTLRVATKELSGISDSPDLDARWLLLHVLERSEDTWLLAHAEERLEKAQENKFSELLERRQSGEPLAYILGEWEFYGRRFKVTPDVLVPRPATEDLVDEALNYIRGHSLKMVADIGTGSGVIAITLALELTKSQFSMTNFQLIATDISPAALDIARENAKRRGVADKITWLEGDMLNPIKDLRIDLIVSNPPYVPTDEIESGNLKFDPCIALDGGADGQDYIKQLKKAGVPTLVETTGGKVEWLSK